jgi:hypothetical protein
MDDVFEVPAHYEFGAEDGCQCDVRRVVAGIVATARIHRLRLVTSDQRIVESKLVPVVE